MKSGRLGKTTLAVEVTNVSRYGFWIFIGESEHFVPFQEFPWFREARIGELLNVELPSPHHLYWPDLDIDLAVESLEHPDRFPLVSQSPSNSVAKPTMKTRRTSVPRRKRAARRV